MINLLLNRIRIILGLTLVFVFFLGGFIRITIIDIQFSIV